MENCVMGCKSFGKFRMLREQKSLEYCAENPQRMVMQDSRLLDPVW